MDFFDKTTKAVRDLSNATREQTELANLKIQKAAIEKKLGEPVCGDRQEICRLYRGFIQNDTV